MHRAPAGHRQRVRLSRMETLIPIFAAEFGSTAWDLKRTEWDGGQLLLKLKEERSLPKVEGRVAHVFFQSVVFTRSIDESYLLVQLAEWKCPIPGLVFRVENSRLPAEIAAWSRGINDHLSNLTHYAVLSTNGCVDVLAAHPPEVWIHEVA
jgi:hypothetical protein